MSWAFTRVESGGAGVANILIGFISGALLGLAARPLLDAYVLWRAQETVRVDAQPPDLPPVPSRGRNTLGNSL
jgi:hypothetical protein